MFKTLRAALAALLLAFLVLPNARASDQDVKSFVAGVAQDAITAINAHQGDSVGLKTAFHDLLLAKFDMQAMGRFALGRYARQLTPDQQARYNTALVNYVAMAYSMNLANVRDAHVNVTTIRPQAEGWMVDTVLGDGSSAPLRVSWAVSRDGSTGSYRITDVTVEGVSMSFTYRQQFTSLISNGGKNGIENLIRLLEKKAAQ